MLSTHNVASLNDIEADIVSAAIKWKACYTGVRQGCITWTAFHEAEAALSRALLQRELYLSQTESWKQDYLIHR